MNDINFDKSFLGKKTDFSSQVDKKKKVKVSTHDILIRLGAFDDEHFNQKVSLKKHFYHQKIFQCLILRVARCFTILEARIT